MKPEQAAADKRRHKEELLQHPNGQAVLAFLVERGEVTSAEVAASCGFGQGTAKRWLNRFVELGLATRQFQGIKGQHGGRRVIYRSSTAERTELERTLPGLCSGS